MPKHKEVFINSIANPLQVGIYEDKQLIKSYFQAGKTSDILPKIFQDILQQYQLSAIYYVNGVGSYMALKIAYIFLKTISIVNNIQLFATDGFNFNRNSPIKALGNKYFIKNGDEVILDNLNDRIIYPFEIPQKLNQSIFNDDNLPNYPLPAV